jgi:hypothetical protein
MYKRLARVLYRTRDTLHAACVALDINSEEIHPELMLVAACDNCSYWLKPKQMTLEPDGTLYCPACIEADYYENENRSNF